MADKIRLRVSKRGPRGALTPEERLKLDELYAGQGGIQTLLADLQARLAALEGGTVPSVPPVIAVQPAFEPDAAAGGDEILLHLGVATGSPDPVAAWDLLRDGVSVKDAVVGFAFVAEAGTYTLLVTWTNTAGSIDATMAALVIDAPAVGVPTGLMSGLTMPSQPKSMPPNLVPEESAEFSSAAGWSAHPGFSIDTEAGRGNWDGTQTTQQQLSIPLSTPAVAGREYGIVVSAASRSAGQLSQGLGTPNPVNAGGILSAPRTRSARVTAAGPSSSLRLTVNPGTIMSLDYACAYDLSLLKEMKWRVVLKIAQSNDVGSESSLTDAVRFRHEPRALFMPFTANAPYGAEMDANGFGRLMIACDPAQHQTANTGGGPTGAFCTRMSDGMRDDEVLVVLGSAYAGAGMLGEELNALPGYWNPDGGVAWSRTLAAARYVQEIMPEGSTFIGGLGRQGESDRSMSNGPRHAARFKSIWETLRGEFGDFPVIMTEIGGEDVSEGSPTWLMIQEHHKLATGSGDALSIPRCTYLPRLPGYGFTDGTHYDQPSQEDFGRRQADALLAWHYGLVA